MDRYIDRARAGLDRERRLAAVLAALGWREDAIVRVLLLCRAIERGRQRAQR